jgi:hypothetical protein
MRRRRLEPMTRALIAVAVALVALIGGLSLAVYLTRDENNIAVDNMLAEKLTKAIALSQSQGEDVDLARQAPFAWDHVLLVARGVSRAAISRRLGRPWTGEVGFRPQEQFLFLRGGRVVRFADYRGEGRFAGFSKPFDLMPRARAVLRVRDLVIRPGCGAARGAAPGCGRAPAP